MNSNISILKRRLRFCISARKALAFIVFLFIVQLTDAQSGSAVPEFGYLQSENKSSTSTDSRRAIKIANLDLSAWLLIAAIGYGVKEILTTKKAATGLVSPADEMNIID